MVSSGRGQVRQRLADDADDPLQKLLGVACDDCLILRRQVEVEMQQVADHGAAVVVRAAQDDLVRGQAVNDPGSRRSRVSAMVRL